MLANVLDMDDDFRPGGSTHSTFFPTHNNMVHKNGGFIRVTHNTQPFEDTFPTGTFLSSTYQITMVTFKSLALSDLFWFGKRHHLYSMRAHQDDIKFLQKVLFNMFSTPFCEKVCQILLFVLIKIFLYFIHHA